MSTFTQYRKIIDQIDEEIIVLLRKRIAFAAVISKTKQQQNNRTFAHAVREAEVTKNAVDNLTDLYTKEAVTNIWRMLISSYLHRERKVAGREMIIATTQDCYWLSREYFGSFIQYRICKSTIESIKMLCADTNIETAVLSYMSLSTERWWLHLSNSKVKIFAIAPFVKTTDVSYTFLAGILPIAASGNDTSILIVQDIFSDEHLHDILQQNNIVACILDRYQENFLLVVRGFISCINGAKSTLIGCYANPL